MTDTYSLPFSLFTRYKSLANRVNDLRAGTESLNILEVGGRGNYLRKFLPEDKITVLDVEDSPDDNYVKGDGRKLPFEDDSFDVVVSTDVLEHITSSDRKKFLDEQQRVSKGIIILACPTNTDWIVRGEKRANELYRFLSGKDHPWLIEHIDYTLPSRDAIEDWATGKKLQIQKIFNQQPNLWAEMVMIDIVLPTVYTPRVSDAFAILSRFYNENVFSFDFGQDGYRSIYIFSKNKIKKFYHKTFSDIDPDNLVTLYSLTGQFWREVSNHWLDELRTKIVEVSMQANQLKKSEKANVELMTQVKQLKKRLGVTEQRLNDITSSRAYKLWKKIRGS